MIYPIYQRISACAMVILTLAAAAAAVAGTPCWPLELGTRYLTSDFMEHRSGRFHTGIDLKTGSRSGFVVRAAEDGWISRLKTSAGGYGKAVYLRGESGRTYVYAHLERFRDDLAQRIAAAQRKTGRYGVDVNVPPRAIRVVRGETLALSGESGTLGPHLHFEVRDAAQRPLNPQREGFLVGDSVLPRILGIRAHPAAPQSRISGLPVAHVIRSETSLAGDLPFLAIQGPVAFSAAVVDASDIRGHRLEPYRLTVRLDGATVFEARNDRLAFDQNGASRLEWLETADGRERWLMQRAGNELPGRRGGRWSLDPDVLIPGKHYLTLEVADVEGNAVSAGFELRVGSTNDPQSVRAPGWLPEPVAVELPRSDSGCERRLTPFLLVETDDGFDYRVGPAADVGSGLPWRVLAPDTLSANEKAAALERQGLRAAGFSLRCLAADWPAAHPVPVELAGLQADSLGADIALYLQGPQGDWDFVDNPRFDPVAGGWIVDLSGPGRYALFGDIVQPYLGPGPFEGLFEAAAEASRPGFAARRWQTVSIGLEDRGSGIDPDAIAAYLDGSPLIVEPDLPRHRLLVVLPDSLDSARHTLDIKVADNAGHRVSRSYLPAPAP